MDKSLGIDGIVILPVLLMMLLVLVALFMFLIPGCVGIMQGVPDGPAQDCYEIELSSGDTYFTNEYLIDDDGKLHIYDYYEKPIGILWDFKWELEYQDRTFPSGSYTITEYEGR